jgi:molybdenum cofactor synthesis domain-containing protein
MSEITNLRKIIAHIIVMTNLFTAEPPNIRWAQKMERANKMESVKYTAAVLTVSDKASIGEREDTGGPLLASLLTEAGFDVRIAEIVPDEILQIKGKLKEYADVYDIALIATTGGTGFSPRDVTPEATMDICDRLTPGIPEAMRRESFKITNRAVLTREAAGIRKRSLIINLPGSPKAIRENLEVVLPSLEHGLDVLRGGPADCGSPA